jgi:hypothetical protein
LVASDPVGVGLCRLVAVGGVGAVCGVYLGAATRSAQQLDRRSDPIGAATRSAQRLDRRSNSIGAATRSAQRLDRRSDSIGAATRSVGVPPRRVVRFWLRGSSAGSRLRGCGVEGSRGCVATLCGCPPPPPSRPVQSSTAGCAQDGDRAECLTAATESSHTTESSHSTTANGEGAVGGCIAGVAPIEETRSPTAGRIVSDFESESTLMR